MNFDALDRRMRHYETWRDQCALAETFLVARIDGRGFTRLTREKHHFECPYDADFRDLMRNLLQVDHPIASDLTKRSH